MYFWTLAFKNLQRRKLRTILTCLGIAVAIGAVVALVGIAKGFEKGFVEVFEARGIDLIVVEGGITEQLTSSLDQKVADRIRSLAGVKEVACMLLEVLVFEKENLLGVMVQGWEPDSFLFRDVRIIAGRGLLVNDQAKAMLGALLAKNMKKTIGDTFEIDNESFEIVGIFDSFNVFENGSVVVPLPELQRVMMRPGQVTAMAVTLVDAANKQQVIKATSQQIESFTNDAGKPMRLSALPAQDYVNSTLQIRMAQAMAWVTSTIALLIGIIGMLNTMMTSVMERTKEIGILRALGWRKTRVMHMILSESVLQSLLGAGVGILAAIMLIKGLSQSRSVNGFIQGDLSWIVLSQGVIVALAMGMMGGLYPAWYASRMTPTEAIRHE